MSERGDEAAAATERAATAPVDGAIPRPVLVDDLDERLRLRRETDWWTLLACLAVVVAAISLDVTPRQDGVTLLGWQLPELCAAKRMGSTCPGCGLTRSFVLGAQLDAQAFSLHPVGPLLFALVVLQLPYRSYHLLRTRRLTAQGRREEALQRRSWPVFRVTLGLFATLFVIWIARGALSLF